MKISTFIISMVLISLFISVFANFFSGGADAYSVTYSNGTATTLAGFDEFERIENITQDIKDGVLGEDDDEGGFSLPGSDLVGFFLGSGFNTLKLTDASFEAFRVIMQNLVEAMQLPGYFFDVLITVALLLFIFIIISVLVGRNV